MKYMIDVNGNYFEAERNPRGETEVPQRPTANHVWQNGAWVYVAPPPKTPAEIAAEARQAAAIRIAAIKDELVEHLATNLAGTPAEKGQALAAIGLLRAELALEKAKL